MSPAGEHAASQSRELRIAVAMRGGVSLAVWIGGVVAELDLVRRSKLADGGEGLGELELARVTAYRDALAGYDSVAIDVLGGASAGGLNAVIYGYAQAHGRSLERLESIWKTQGDIWSLFHDRWEPDQPYRLPSLFKGDAHFYKAIEEELPHLDGGLLPVGRVSVDLSATLLDGPRLPDTSHHPDARPRAAHFHFRHDANTRDLDRVDRLAYAARTTSSFPGAFEPARIYSGAPPEGDLPSGMEEVFSERSSEDTGPFRVFDGGVLDNIPIGRTLQAVADAPTDKAVTRILIYLDPSPPAIPFPEPATRTGGTLTDRFARTALTALRFKQRQESSDEDLIEIRRLTRLGEEFEERHREFMRARLDPTELGDLDVLAAFRAAADSRRLVELLLAPGTGFLRSRLPAPQAPKVVLAEGDAVQARTRLKDTLNTPPVEATLLSDANARIAAAAMLITEALDKKAFEQLPAVFDLRARATERREKRDRAAFAVFQAATYPDVAWNEVGAALRGPKVDAVDTEAGGTKAETGDDEAAEAEVDWVSLTQNASAILGRAIQVSGLQALAAAYAMQVGEDLSPVVPKFYVISADEPTPSGVGVDPGTAEATATVMDQLVSSRAELTRDLVASRLERPMSATTKLAGAQLGNFAGFLSAEWRQRDWEWARVDGSRGVLRILKDVQNAEVTPPATGPVAPTGPRPTMAALKAPHRYAIITRLLLTVQRALWPLSPEAAFQFRYLPGVVALMVLRPLLVLAPLVTRPALLVGVVGSALASVLAEAHANLVAQAYVAVALLAGAVALEFVRRGRARRWRALRDLVEDPDKDRCSEVTSRLRAVMWWPVALGVVGIAVALCQIVEALQSEPVSGIPHGSGFVSTTIGAGLLALGVTSVARAGKAVRGSSEQDCAGWIVAAGSVALTAAAATYDRAIRDGGTDLVVAVVAAAIVLAVHLEWTPVRWNVGVTVWTGALTSGAVAVDLSWELTRAPGVRLAVALVVIFVLVWSARKIGPTPALVLTSAAVVFGWVWVVPVGSASVPTGLAVGALACAVTTLFVPFRQCVDQELQPAKGAS